MASLRDAYQRVREQTERNNAAKDEGGNIFQPLFANVLNELNQDLDPANVNKPLSGYGALLDSVTGFRENQIEKAAELQAKRNLKAYEYGAPQREMELAEGLAAQAEGQKQANRNSANAKFKGLLPLLNKKGNIDSELIGIVDKNPAFFSTFKALQPNNIFHIVPEGVPTNISMGEAIHTLSDGQRLFASGDKAYININKIRKNITEVFHKKLKDEGFTDNRIANLYKEDKEKLFEDEGFLRATKNTFASQPEDFATLVQAHEQYYEALTKKTQQMSDALTKNNARLTSLLGIAVSKERTALGVFQGATSDENKTIWNEAKEQVYKVRRLLISNQLDGSFLQLASAVVHRNAFAISMVRGIPTNKQTAAQNIDLAMKISMNDPSLLRYKRQITAYFDRRKQPLLLDLENIIMGDMPSTVSQETVEPPGGITGLQPVTSTSTSLHKPGVLRTKDRPAG